MVSKEQYYQITEDSLQIWTGTITRIFPQHSSALLNSSPKSGN